MSYFLLRFEDILIRRIGLLPLIICAFAIIIPFRVNNLWFNLIASPIVPTSKEIKDSSDQNLKNSTSEVSTSPTLNSSTISSSPGDKSVAKSEGTGLTPEQLTPEKIHLLQSLAQRRQELHQVEQDIERRKILLEAMAVRLDKHSNDIRKIRDEIQNLIKQRNDQQTAETVRLARMYEKMKPETAALIMQGLTPQTLLNLMREMTENKASSILANMDPVVARALTQELAKQQTSPEQLQAMQKAAQKIANQALKG